MKRLVPSAAFAESCLAGLLLLFMWTAGSIAKTEPTARYMLPTWTVPAASLDAPKADDDDPSESSEGPEPGFDPKSIYVGPTLLFDAATGEVLSQSRAGEIWYPASLTKLMTAYVVFEKLRAGELRLDQKISVSKLAARQPASRVGLGWGNTITVDLALQALLIYSANDMAYVLAEAASGTHFHFGEDMNKAAAKLGMTGSNFVNPNGLYDPRHYTTARDMGLLAAALYRDFPEHSHYFSQEYVDIGKRRLHNRNMLIRLMETADGMKTGFVCDSGFNLVASATENDRKLIAVVMGTKSGYARAVLAKYMLEKGFATSANASNPKLATITDEAFGAKPIEDMTKIVCRRKDVAELTEPSLLYGAGISFGLRATADEADKTLHDNLLSPVGRKAMGFAAAYRLPDKSGYMPLIHGMGPGDAQITCNAFRATGVSCSVVPEFVMNMYGQMYLDGIARRKEAKAQKAQVPPQGSDSPVTNAAKPPKPQAKRKAKP